MMSNGDKALENLAKLKLSDPGVEEKILAACQIKFSEERALPCVNLALSGHAVVLVKRDEKVGSLKAKLDVIRGRGFDKIDRSSN